MTSKAPNVPLLGVIVGRLAGASVKVSVMVAVSSMFSALSSLVIVTVGAVVSTINEPEEAALAPDPLMVTATVYVFPSTSLLSVPLTTLPTHAPVDLS